LNGRVKAKQW